jgi:RimJ/RimL family protein N-acetyltransferase
MKRNTTPGLFVFAVQLLDDSPGQSNGPVIGFVGIGRPPEIFYLLGPAYWGKGYATEMVKGFLDAYWTRFPDGLPAIEKGMKDVLLAFVYDGNKASEGVLKKCGFQYTRSFMQDRGLGERLVNGYRLVKDGGKGGITE